MKLRPIENKEGLRLLIITTLEEKKEPFTLGELIEDVFKDEAFNEFCSREVLHKNVSEVVEAAWEANIIAYYPQFPFSGQTKYIVVT